MNSPIHWFIDFDETLATGSLTWAQESAFPKLIQEYGLVADAERLDQTLMLAQEQSSRDYDPLLILDELFVTMGWPLELTHVLMADIYNNYQPRLFEDALVLLRRLRQTKRRAFVISNNPLSAKYVKSLGIENLIDAVYTPRMFAGARAKPHPDLWELITGLEPEVTKDNSAIVGDDPWADGRFAVNCGVRCYLVDRAGRFTDHPEQSSFEWIRSLDNIVLS